MTTRATIGREMDISTARADPTVALGGGRHRRASNSFLWLSTSIRSRVIVSISWAERGSDSNLPADTAVDSLVLRSIEICKQHQRGRDKEREINQRQVKKDEEKEGEVGKQTIQQVNRNRINEIHHIRPVHTHIHTYIHTNLPCLHLNPQSDTEV